MTPSLEFSGPPLTELSLSLHFDPLPSLRTAHLGLLWDRFRRRFPKTEEHPPIEPPIEKFGVPIQPTLGVQVEMVSAPPVPRLWFLTDDGDDLIQVQQDLFARNWRKVTGSEEYPRFERVRASFEREFGELRQFLVDEKLGEIVPRQCEIAYINHIDRAAGWDGRLDKILTMWHPHDSEEFPPSAGGDLEDARFGVRYIIRNSQQEPLGRFYIEAQPAVRISDREPVLRLTLTARGRPSGDSLEGVRGFMDLGHEWALRGFAAITTAEVQKAWGRHDAH